jgi:hypothetical protein
MIRRPCYASAMTRAFALVFACLGVTTAGCEMESGNSRPQYPQQPGYYGGYPPGQPPPPGYGQPPPPGYGQPPQPGQPPPPGTAPGKPAQPPLPPVAYDPINSTDILFLRGRAQAVIQELIAALEPASSQKVAGIPLIVDDRVGEVNAFAACTKGGKSVMAISDGLLDIESHLARTKATDEIFGTQKTGQYIQLIAKNQKPGQPIVRPAPGFFDPGQDADGRKVKRQHEILDEQIAFVLGHELGHHYLGHLPCTASGGGGVTAAEVSHVLSNVIPIFNQPNELGADVSGTNNVLAAGKRRAPAYHWTEGGGLLTMQFFAGLDSMSPIDIVFGFERSHPPPQIRTPVIQQTASQWRSSGGQGWKFPGLPF